MNFWDTISTDLKNRFRRNFEMSKGRGMDFEKFLNRNNTNKLIVRRAFTWINAPEGFEFWSMIDSMWFELLEAEKAGNVRAKVRLAKELGHIKLG